MKVFKFLAVLLPWLSYGQDSLSLESAVALALEHNHQLHIAGNTRQMAAVAANWGNAGLLPTVSLNGSAGYNVNNTELEIIGQPTREINGAQSTSLQGSVNVAYTLFDGFGNIYSYRRLEKQDEQAAAVERLERENTLLQVVRAYYELAQADDNLEVAHQTLEISLDRYRRADLRAQSGANTELERFNAAVDLKNDSVALLQATVLRTSAQRNLNFLMGRNTETEVEPVKTVNTVPNLSLEILINQATSNNAALLQAAMQEDVNTLDLREARSDYLPQLDLNLGYGVSQNENEASVVTFQRNNGLTAGLTLRWNLFNANRTRTRVQTAHLALLSSRERLELTKLQLERDLRNAWDQYRNTVYVLEVQKRNLQTARLNFERSRSLSRLGQITGTQFREAQLNLQQAELNHRRAAYQIKLAEVELRRLAGLLLNSAN